MRLEQTFLVLATALVTSRCSKHSRLGVYGGSPTSIEDHPQNMAVYVDGIYNCVGVPLTAVWILTPADAVGGLIPSQVMVCAGCNDATPRANGTMVNVTDIVVHPQYNYTMFDYVGACMRLAQALVWSPWVQPATLPAKDPRPGTALKVAGWGDTGSAKGVGRQLMEGQMNWLSPARCNATLSPYGLKWTDSMACAFDKTKKKNTLCKGDWGVPFMKNGVVYGMMVAVPTRGMCSDQAKPLVLANVGSMVEWIKETIQA